jgi:hypothetical protein
MTTHAQRVERIVEQFNQADARNDAERKLKAALDSCQRERNRLEAENAEMRRGLIRLANGHVKVGHEALFAHAVLDEASQRLPA